MSTYSQEHYQKNKDKYIQRAKAWYLNNKQAKKDYDKQRRLDSIVEIREADINRYYLVRKTSKYNMLRSAKQRAKKRNIYFNLTIDDFDFVDVCPVLGIALQFNFGSGGKDNSPTLDRIDNNLGYIPGNVQVISAKANRMKSNGSPEDIQKLYAWMISIYPHFEI